LPKKIARLIMPYKQKTTPVVKYGNIQEVMRNKLKRSYFSFRYNPDGTCYYQLGDHKFTIEDFEKRYPIELMPSFKKGENSDRTKNWMYNKKSY
jgi:hypothetical protein